MAVSLSTHSPRRTNSPEVVMTETTMRDALLAGIEDNDERRQVGASPTATDPPDPTRRPRLGRRAFP